MIGASEYPGKNAPTSALIEHIRGRYHNTHRRELPELITLARKVETIYATDPNAPHGLTQALSALVVDLEYHMQKEEKTVFAAHGAERCLQTNTPIDTLRQEHDTNEATMNQIAAITHGFRLPDYASVAWTQLYAGLSKLVDDLDEQMFLENTVLFPRFET